MGDCRVFVEVGFQGRLRNVDERVRATVFAFRKTMIRHELEATSIPGFATVTHTEIDEAGRELYRDIELKILGTWTFIRVETRAPGVFVLHDRTH